jgi:hypothetical protein
MVGVKHDRQRWVFSAARHTEALTGATYTGLERGAGEPLVSGNSPVKSGRRTPTPRRLAPGSGHHPDHHRSRWLCRAVAISGNITTQLAPGGFDGKMSYA